MPKKKATQEPVQANQTQMLDVHLRELEALKKLVFEQSAMIEGLKQEISKLSQLLIGASEPTATAPVSTSPTETVEVKTRAVPTEPLEEEFINPSEYNDILIPTRLLEEHHFREKYQAFTAEVDVIAKQLKDVIRTRLQKTKLVGQSKSFLVQNIDRDPVKIYEKKLVILQDVKKVLHEILACTDKPGTTTTELMKLLDDLYNYDEVLFRINRQALTPTHEGPIIILIKKISEDLLDFLTTVVEQSQNASP